MTKEFKTPVNHLHDYFRSAVFAGEYKAWVIFKDEIVPATGGGEVYANIWVDSEYLEYKVTFFRSSFRLWEQKKYRTLADVICHELCHVLTDPLYKHGLQSCSPVTTPAFERTNERQTQRICNSILALVPAKVWRPKKASRPSPPTAKEPLRW